MNRKPNRNAPIVGESVVESAHWRRCRLLLLALCAGLAPCHAVDGAPPGDDRLLRDLPAGRSTGTKAEGKTGQPAGSRNADSPSTRPRKVDLDRGAWERLAEWAAEAARRLADGETGEPTQKHQQRIVQQLAEIAKRQRRPGASRTTKTPRSGRSRQAPKGASAPKDAAEGAPDAGGGKSHSGENRSAPRQIADRVWGHLPPRVQSRLRALGSVRYLPGYEKQIESYYRRLAK